MTAPCSSVSVCVHGIADHMLIKPSCILLHEVAALSRSLNLVRLLCSIFLLAHLPVACSLSLYALTVLPVQTYALLCGLKIATTGLVYCLVLPQQLNKQATSSLLLLFLGTSTACFGVHQQLTAGSTAGQEDGLGLLAVLSAGWI